MSEAKYTLFDMSRSVIIPHASKLGGYTGQRHDKDQHFSFYLDLLISKGRDGQLHTSIYKKNYDCKELLRYCRYMPYKDRNFDQRILGKGFYFVIWWLVIIGFRQNYFHKLPNFGDFWAKMSFFHYIINQKTENVY